MVRRTRPGRSSLLDSSRPSGFGSAMRPGMTIINKLAYIICAAASLPDRRIRLEQIAYVNGSFVPMSEAKVSILDRGFLFADGIYEVAAVLDGKLIDTVSH